ncbi:XTP/dITP diphosphatase [bacterium LRH843]|nr:XTP/dITP diphosphatase [bacterium LRH843]
MKKEVIIATKNKGKIYEFEQLFAEVGCSVKSLLDYPDIPDIVEDGKTFAENAAKKAETIAKTFGQMVIADDSGLVVDALEGRPGIYSARYASEEKSDAANNEKVLRELVDIPAEDRTARFVCTIAVARPDRQTLFYEGKCEGIIAREAIGHNGFGYDPIFYIPRLGKTMAQLTSKEKNERSHRSEAMNKLLKSKFEWNE